MEHLSRLSGVAVNRNRADEAAAHLIHEVGLHTQAEVIRLHEQGVAGFGPANPVSMSSHCGRNDGIVRPDLPPGAELPDLEAGIDTDNSPRFIQVARQQGVVLTLTYPDSSGERQHVNPHVPRSDLFLALPDLAPPGHRRRPHPHAVWELSRFLMGAHVPHHLRVHGRGPYYLRHHHARYTEDVARVVRDFQRDHHLQPDGDVGLATWLQLRRSYLYWTKGRGER